MTDASGQFAPPEFGGATSAVTRRVRVQFGVKLERGVYPPASQFEAWFVSLAHGDEHVERTADAAREAFASL